MAGTWVGSVQSRVDAHGGRPQLIHILLSEIRHLLLVGVAFTGAATWMAFLLFLALHTTGTRAAIE